MAPDSAKKEEGGKEHVNKKESKSKDSRGQKQKQETPRNKTSDDKSKHKSDNTQGSGKKDDSKSNQDSNTQNMSDKDSKDTPRSEQETEKQKREYCKEELNRLKGSLKKEKEKIKKPEKKDFSPYIFNTLEPYYNVQTAKFLIEEPGDVEHGNVSRLMSKGLVDPWVDHRMDIDLLPKIESKTVTSPRGDNKPKKDDKERPPKEGSTRLPEYPTVQIPKDERSSKPLYYNDVPTLREELHKTYSSNASGRVQKEYKRTKQDFYRMELDKMDEYHPDNRDNMKAAYYAYLTNNAGSRKAIQECVKDVEKKEKEKEKQKQQSDKKSQKESQDN